MPAIIGLVGVLVGAAIITASNYILAIRKEATETRNWWRDRCLAAYSDFLRQTKLVTHE